SKARVAGFVPQSSLDGMVNTLNAALRWNWKPVSPVSVNIRGKYYDIDNRTPELDVEQVNYDTSYSTYAPTRASNASRLRRSLPFSYDKANAGADCYYSIAKSLSMKLAYDWERYGFDFYEAKATQEDIYSVSLKAGPFFDLVVRPSYQYARRIVKDYNEEVHWAEESFPLGEGTALGEMPELRKFDLAGRKRHKVAVRADWDPLDYLNTGVDYGLIRDDYFAEYGAQDGRTLYYSVDASVNPSDRLGFYADYSWEQVSTFARSRYRTSTADDVAANDWSEVLKDTAHSVNAGAQYVLLKDKLDADVGWGMTYLKGLQEAKNLGTPTTASANASDFPNTYSRLQKLRANMRYRWSQSLTARLGYEYQRYTITDWAQDDLNVYQADWNTSVFLGAAQTGYEAHLFSLGLSYAF
ncbi:MAG: MtrB/PioB family outer membrane beta-barrel protein, partial [Elusimicrobia bacterium]|nr:MtrB/PioB family outer membrane beta-barrel protein [Elusimicrobiota bacterium]